MIRTKIETQDVILSLTKNCEQPIKQTHRKPQGTLEIELTQPSETFSFTQPVSIEGCWMVRLTNLEVYNSVFIIKEEKNNFELCIFPDSKKAGFSHKKVRDGILKDLEISNITATSLQKDLLGPISIEKIEKKYQKE